jgi:polyphosphate glucokinase
MTPEMMIAGVKKLAADWKFTAVSIGYPGPVLHNKPVIEPHNPRRRRTGRWKYQAAEEATQRVPRG